MHLSIEEWIYVIIPCPIFESRLTGCKEQSEITLSSSVLYLGVLGFTSQIAIRWGLARSTNSKSSNFFFVVNWSALVYVIFIAGIDFDEGYIIRFLLIDSIIFIVICNLVIAWVYFRNLLSRSPFFGLPRPLHTSFESGDSFLVFSFALSDQSLIIRLSVAV